MLIKAFVFLLKLILSVTPLWLIQILGSILGQLFHRFNKKDRRILIENMTHSNLYKNRSDLNRAICSNFSETGKTILETTAIWASSQERVLKWIRRVDGIAHIQKARQSGKGTIFLTPHLGAYEITSIYYGSFYPITILYRPLRKGWLMNFMAEGREKGFVKLAPTNSLGIKSILMALRKGEAVGILPDQIANKGEGEWAPFFNRPALTMTLVSRLAKRTGATVIMAYGERLGLGKGFIIQLEKIDAKDIETPSKLNLQLEKQITKNPTQYLWNYDRHKGHESK